MRALQNWMDRFCMKHPNLGIPGLMRFIVFGNILVYLLNMFSNGSATALLNFNSFAILHHAQIWRLVTFVFVPYNSGGLFFLAIMLYFYYFIGSALEREWGTCKFTIFYIVGIIMNIVVGFIVGSASMYYVNMSMFFAFATLYPDLQFLLFFIIPVKAKWLAWLDAAFFAWMVISSVLSGHFIVALFPIIAVFNYLLFFASDIMGFLSGAGQRNNFRRTSGGPKVVNFHGHSTKTKEGYLHKCAVCGRTDTNSPGLEFRYCSRCNGSYCYCIDHINSHIHIT